MGRPESVHVAYFPEPADLTAGIDDAARKRAGNWDRLMEVRGDVLKSLESARNDKLIGAPLEARVRLSGPDAAHTAEALTESMTLFADGRLRLRAHRTLPMQDAAEAHRLLESGTVHERIILTLP